MGSTEIRRVPMIRRWDFLAALGTDAFQSPEIDDLNKPHVFETFGTVLDPVPVGNRAFVFLLNAEFDFPFEKFFGAVGKFFGKAGFFRILPGFFRGKAFGFLAPGTGFKPALCGGILALTLLFPQTVFPQEASSDLGRNQAGESIKTFAEKNTCEPAYRQSDEKAGKKGEIRKCRARVCFCPATGSYYKRLCRMGNSDVCFFYCMSGLFYKPVFYS